MQRPIGKQIKEARKEANCTLEQLSNRTGIPMSTLVRMESDKYLPKLANLLSILHHIGGPFWFDVRGNWVAKLTLENLRNKKRMDE
jgi:transcriptional regulator with XRE-family HTH domain